MALAEGCRSPILEKVNKKGVGAAPVSGRDVVVNGNIVVQAPAGQTFTVFGESGPGHVHQMWP